MQIKIGVIGMSHNVDKLLKTLTAFPTFEPVVQYIDHEEQLLDNVEQIKEEIEVLILFGAQAYRKVKDNRHLSVPVHYVPLTGSGLFKTLFCAFKDGRLHNGLSVDSLTKTMVMSALGELGLEQLPVYIYKGPAHASHEQLFQFHYDRVTDGSASIAVSGDEETVNRLDAAGVACQLLVPSSQDMTVTLERALLSTESRRNKEAQIVVGMINVDEFGKLVMKRSNEHEVQKLKLDIHRMVLDYVESLDGYLASLGGDEYMFFTTRGIFERETGGYKNIPLAKEAGQAFGISLSFGVGFGATANEAGTNARSALRKSKDAGGNSCFIVREDQTLIGPLEMADPVQTVLAPTDAELIKKAEDAGMTNAYLSKLLSNMARFGKFEYKVHELASLLNITVRSAHRLLAVWIDSGLVEISGMEKVPRGRPRQIFKFNFLVEQ